MYIDDVINKEVDGLVKKKRTEPDHTGIESYDSKTYHESKSRPDRKILLEDYRRQCNEYLTAELKWPENLAKKITRKLSVPKEKITWKDWMIGLSIGNLPDRYLEPVARIMRTDKRFYTGINILADVFFIGASTFLLYELNAEHKSEIMTYICDFMNHGGPKFLLYANAITRVLQTPYRSIQYFRGKHTWSPATIINPNIPEAIAVSLFVGYDQMQKYKERRIEKIISKSQ